MTLNRDMTKGARFAFYLMQFVMGGVFWFAAASGHFIMSEEVYGAAVAWPAELWAGCMMFPAAGYLAALFINGGRWWTPHLRMGFGIFMMLYYSAFVALGFPSAGIDLIVIASGVFMVTAFAMLCFDTQDLLRGRHAGT